MDYIRDFLTNMFVFCNPVFNYKEINLLSKNLIFIDKGKNKNDISNYIPCLFLPEYDHSSKFLIYFHGNRDDIFSSELFCQYFSEKLKMNVIIVEYPGYSLYNIDKNATVICEDSIIVYDFIVKKFNAKDDDIYIVGRSLGTGPAVYLASQRNPKSLFLISPFKSIKSIKNVLISFFLKDIFSSIDIINQVKCQIFFIHGKNDPLIDFNHSIELFSKSDNSNNNEKNILILNPEMTHNDFDVEKDIFSQILHNMKENPLSFPKDTYKLEDNNFKGLFDIPIPYQNYLFRLNLNQSFPNKFEISAKCALLLNDGRIAFGKGNSEILIYDIDGSLNELELTIKTNNKYPITFMTQLRNNTFISCDSIYVYFYSLRKFKYKMLDCFNCKDKIKKVEQLENDEIIILTDNSIKILNSEFKQINEIKGKYKDLKVISSKIIISNNNNIEIKEYINGNLILIQKVNFNTIDCIYSIISYNDNFFVALGQNEYIIYDLQNYGGKKFSHKIENPTNIWKVNNNSFLIWNENGEITYFEKDEKSYIIKNINSKNITSMIKLNDGSLIITNDSLQEIKNQQQSNEECIIY
jgi:esterase/lipase